MFSNTYPKNPTNGVKWPKILSFKDCVPCSYYIWDASFRVVCTYWPQRISKLKSEKSVKASKKLWFYALLYQQSNVVILLAVILLIQHIVDVHIFVDTFLRLYPVNSFRFMCIRTERFCLGEGGILSSVMQYEVFETLWNALFYYRILIFDYPLHLDRRGLKSQNLFFSNSDRIVNSLHLTTTFLMYVRTK